MTVIQIIKVGLQQQGYGGRFVPGICGCQLNDLSPGDCLSGECEAGHVHKHSVTGEVVLHKHSEPIGDERIQQIIDEC